jgi:signal transduction histidine kinase
MPYRHKLRFRIFLSYPLLGLLLSALMVAFVIVAFDSLERQMIGSYLIGELDHFIQQAERNPALSMQASKNWIIYKEAGGKLPDEIGFLSGYPEGIHDVDHNRHSYDVVIKAHNSARYYIVHDDTGLERLEYKLITYLFAAVVIILWMSAWSGLWLSKKVIEPISTLASRIRTLNLENSSDYISVDYTNDEVGMLALEFDVYKERLQALIQREREFTGNASHELRTPLAIIMAAAEGLLLRPDLPDDIRLRVERMQRSATEMKARLATLLSLARGPVSMNEATDKTELVAIIDRLTEEHRNLLSPQVQVIKKFNGSPRINASSPVISMLMGNLIRNAFTYTRQGSVTISLYEDAFVVADTGQGIDTDELNRIFERGYRGQASQGSGLGLAISRRICEYYGWQLKIDSVKDEGTQVQCLFSSDSTV